MKSNSVKSTPKGLPFAFFCRLQALASSGSMGSGRCILPHLWGHEVKSPSRFVRFDLVRSAPCCHVSAEELKQGGNTSSRDGQGLIAARFAFKRKGQAWDNKKVWSLEVWAVWIFPVFYVIYDLEWQAMFLFESTNEHIMHVLQCYMSIDILDSNRMRSRGRIIRLGPANEITGFELDRYMTNAVQDHLKHV